MFSFIPFVYLKVLCFFGMSSTSNKWREIPTDYTPTSISNYCGMLQAEYNSEGIGRMDDILVDEVRLYKTKETSRHEYISVKARAPNKASFYLAIERERGEIVDKVNKKDDPNDNDTQHLPAAGGSLPGSTSNLPQAEAATASSPRKSSLKEKLSSLPSSSSSITSLDKLYSKRNAHDTVTLLSSGKHNTHDEVFRTISFASAIPLWKVAVLADTLHNMRRHYLLFSDNCYYYAGTIIKVLQESMEYNPTVHVDTTGCADVDEQQGLKKGAKNKAGMWHRIPIYAGEAVDTEPLKREFAKALANFTSTVRERANKREEDANARKAAEAETARVQKEAEDKQKASDAQIARLRKEAEEVRETNARLHAMLVGRGTQQN